MQATATPSVSRPIRDASTRPIRIGIVGCGSVFGAYAWLIDQMSMRNLVKVTRACDVDATLEERVKRVWPDTSFSTQYEDVVGAEDVDLVMVLTSMPDHFRIAHAALTAGKHVLCEKPMATNLADGAELLRLSAQAPGILVCAPHIILSPTYHQIWTRVRRGDIGKVLLARGRYGHRGFDKGRGWYYRAGGGALFDLGVYNITSLTGLLGPVKRVTAFAGTAIPLRHMLDGEVIQSEVVDNAHVLLDFGEAVYAVVTTGFTMPKYRSPAIELYGTEGTLQLLGDDWAPEGYELYQKATDAWQVYADPDPSWEWTDGFRHLIDCIRNGTRPLNTPEHAFHVLEVMLKAEAAGQDGVAKEIDSTFRPIDLGEAQPSHFEEHDRRISRARY